MSWQIEIPLIVRTLISDLADSPTYSDDRLQQTIVIAASYVQREMNFDTEYDIDLVNLTITPDPAVASTRDEDFIGFSALRAGCFLDQSTFRTKAASEGIRTQLGPANLSVAGNLKGYQMILETGPCAMYDKLKLEYEIGNIKYVKAVLSPFVGNKFDPRSLLSDHGDRDRTFYS
jgi:hypothetical protein|tara:strand:- start:933 stop:1457 length:525 start_codon:yes stop_codon:yes gene_type:complete